MEIDIAKGKNKPVENAGFLSAQKP